MKISPLLLSGGSGTRLWPISRVSRPKQFLPITSELSLYQSTLRRIVDLPGVMPAIVVCNESHRFVVAEQAAMCNVALQDIILEPMPRDTAPAIALGALRQLESEDALLLVLPCDHAVENVDEFRKSLMSAVPIAEEGHIVSFGIVPRAPETGFGYIQVSDRVAENCFVVERFVEKPDRNTAKSFLDSGDFFWNSGMILVRASVYLKELDKYSPAVLSACREAYHQARRDLGFLRIDAENFARSPSISVDYGVMEKVEGSRMCSIDVGWSDVGSWAAVGEVADKDEWRNAWRGDVIMEGCENSYAYSTSRLVAIVGVSNITVIETEDAILVAAKDSSQNIKLIVEKMSMLGRPEVDFHKKEFRPWGSYESIAAGKRYQVKRLLVKEGEQISVQRHHHRAEHWVVVSGTALIRVGDEEKLVTENQSVYIPVGEVHCLRNPGKIPLELIEVQSGAYLGEDDIVRLNDIYGRE